MQVIQGVLIVLLSMWMVLDQQGIVITTWFPIMVAFFAGLIMGGYEDCHDYWWYIPVNELRCCQHWWFISA